MTADLKINRARRNVLKAVGITAAAMFAATAYRKPAQAQFTATDPKDIPTYKDDSATSKDSPPSRDPPGTKVCFLRGSKILTADGYRPIETLRVGEHVQARFGGLSPIEKIGSFTLTRTGPNRAWAGASRPVRVKAGALGENCPSIDLCLTASHAVFTNGVLVPVINLVNGTSIVFETAEGQETLDFFHVALARHDVLDAQGAACETWRDAAVEEPCAPMVSFYGGRDELRSRLRSAASIIVDRRQPLDIIRDDLEERAVRMPRAA
jgi:hypothetical protein